MQFTAGILRQRALPESNMARHFVAGQPVVQEGTHLILVKGFPGTQVEHHGQLLAHRRIWHAEHDSFQHLGHFIGRLLDLTGKDVLTSANDDLLDAPGNKQKAILVHAPHVAGLHPALRVKRFGIGFRFAPVTGGTGHTADLHFTPGFRIHFPPLCIDKAQVNNRGNNARTVRAEVEYRTTHGRTYRQCFGHTPSRRATGLPTFLPDQLRQSRRRGCPGSTHPNQGSGIEVIKIGAVQQILNHGGHTGQAGDFFLLNQLQRPARIPFVHDDHLLGGVNGEQETR